MAVFDSLNKTTDTALQKSNELLINSESYYKLKVFQILTSSLALLIKLAIAGSFALIALLFIAISIASAIGNYLDSTALGYVTVAAIFIVLSTITYLLRVRIENIVIRKLSIIFFEDDEKL